MEDLRTLANDLVVALRTVGVARAAMESERRYRLLAENATDVIWILDMETQRFRYVSPSVEKLRGFSPNEVLAQTADETLTAASRAHLEEVLPARLAAFQQGDERSYTDELEQMTKDGGTVWTETHTRFIVDPETRRLEAYGISRDIGERKRSEQALLHLARIHRTLTATNEVIVRAKSERELLQRACDVTVMHLGVLGATMLTEDAAAHALRPIAASGPVAEIVSRNLAPLTEDGGAIAAEAFFTGKVVVENAYDTNAARGPWRSMVEKLGVRSAIALPIERDGRIAAVFTIASDARGSFDPEVVTLLEGMARDLSHGLDHLARAEALRESEERYRSLVENIDDIVYSANAAGEITFMSAAASRLGFAAPELHGRSLFAMVHPQDLAAARSALSEGLAGTRTHVEMRIFDASGKTRWVRASMRRATAGDRVVGLSGVITDQTRQRETEEQLRMAQKMEAVGRLAGGVAHDFNNLLLVILSYTELAMEAARPGDEMHADLDEVRKAALRAAGLTRQLLAFSRKQVMRTEMVDLVMLVSGLEKMLQRLLGEDVELVVRAGSQVRRTRADPGQVEQVIMNLAVNARDAMPGGGTLVIEVDNAELDEERASHILDATPGAYVRLAISDDGVGMDEGTQARVFEPFFTTKEAGKGTGLGLATVYGIVKQSGGCIVLTSAPGAGTRFEIFLPVAASVRSPDPGSARASGRARGHETVLAVEDEEVVRSLVQRVLSSAGYRVLVARTGAEALAMSSAHAGSIDVLVTDLVMPGMNGRELADRVAAERPGIKVLYTSGYTDDVLAQRGALPSGTRFLAKPYLADELLRQVRDALD